MLSDQQGSQTIESWAHNLSQKYFDQLLFEPYQVDQRTQFLEDLGVQYYLVEEEDHGPVLFRTKQLEEIVQVLQDLVNQLQEVQDQQTVDFREYEPL